MNKAILIVDMPDCCYKCTFNNAIGECKFLGNVEVAYDHGLRDVECPLKPLPKEEESTLIFNGERIESAYVKGWNDCLSEIIGDEE